MGSLEEDYAQIASPVSTLHAILEGYPLSVGIFRELLANSDDAGASKQIFVLDRRNHPTKGLYGEGSQGPAFMAFNDAVLTSRDWEALSSIHDSSKVADESKIGKYGVGFRSVFNLTDSPQILSDRYLAIFDPLRRHLKSGGKKIDLEHISSTFPNLLEPFGFFTKGVVASPFPGTVIRCPLRNTPSEISDQVITPQIISELFKEFIDQELGISCLFLNNVNCIEIYEIAATGGPSLLSKMTISRPNPINSTMIRATVEIDRIQVSDRKEWLIIQKNSSRDEAISILSEQPGYNCTTATRALQGAKFSPEVKIAVDITSRNNISGVRGRLFTCLPLPIYTGFPVHIHALFGIDTSRARLRCASVGLMSGSQDHMKVQWNEMLFKTFIPRTWSCLLETMVSKELVSDIFSIWPPERCSGELESYYGSLSGQLVNTLLAANAAVWPVYELENQSTRFRSLEGLVVVSPDEQECVLQALARVGLSLTRPPAYIFELLRDSSENISILDPDEAHRLLLEQVDAITGASDRDQWLLLEYLLSTKNILNICNLPLVPVGNEEKKVTISNVPGTPVYTILTRAEFDIFGVCDEYSIPLHRLPRNVADVLVESGPRSINVQKLTVPRITEYLHRYSKHLNSNPSESKIDPSVVHWLSKFWVWMKSCEYKEELFPQIRNLPLLPSTKGLRTAESPLFKLRDEHHAYTMGYLALGVPFFPREFSEAAHDVMKHYGLAKSISDIPALLRSIPLEYPRLSQPDYESILKHLASRLDMKISPENIQCLRNLPVFPILSMSGDSTSVVTNWTAIPAGHAIRSVGRPRFVPVIDGVSFVGLDNIAPALVKFLEPSQPNPMSENNLVEMAVENFTTQPEHLQLTIIRHITAKRTRIILDIMNKLGSQPFVLAEDGERRVPGEIVDPDSEFGHLYAGCSAHLPSRSGPGVEVLRCLKSLGLLRAHFNPEIIAERVEYISSRQVANEALSVARKLLPLLASSNVDFSQVQGISEKKWLPTNIGLCSAEECRHPSLTPSALFDKVLGILEPFPIPPSLQTALHWDKPLRTGILIRQLDQSLLDSEHCYDTVVEVIKEFGQREWNDEDFDSLERVVRGRQWIPTTSNVLADDKSSVFNFSSTMMNSGFHQIRNDLKAENILRRMGCNDHPSTKAIFEKLYLLNQNPNCVDLVETSISLLKSLPDDIATIEGHPELLIPDKDSQLRPFSEIFYNDIGERHLLVNNDGHFIVHPSLDESLARKLGLNRLGLRYAELQNVGPNMGQAPIITVKRTLQQYTNKQFLLEFLANAEDAKATTFKVAVNLTTVREEQHLQVLSPAMEYLCRLPSLVVYNNAQFTSQDFEGICHTSVGGKEGRPDTIGEFGLGVLTMYHFTDLAMIISGSRVLFLDPLKKHLPLKDHASLNLPLQHVLQFYKHNLIAIDGLFDFNMSLHTYNATLFVLPLRASGGITDEVWSSERIISDILSPFRTYAGDCLLFTGIQTIGCITRSPEGVVTPQWSSQAQKTLLAESETEFVVTDIKISSTDSTAHWKTVTTSRTKDQLPSELQVEGSFLRKPSIVGLAARLDRAPDTHSFNFFSILPLSTPTTLPMHVMASFKLSSDRRQIRLDKYEEMHTKYNSWLLEDLIPPLYLFFLEHLLCHNDPHYRLRWPTDRGDNLSKHVVNSFYSSKHLKASPRLLFPSNYFPSESLAPQGAVLHCSSNPSIHTIMDRLRPHQVVNLPEGTWELAESAGLRLIDPDFVKKEIMLNPGAITSGDNFQMILDIIIYLSSQKDSSDILHGLQILPLQNGSFGTLDTQGKGVAYYVWKDQTKKHNFDEARFVHPKMKTTELERMKLNISSLTRSVIKTFVAETLATFSEHSSLAQWVDSFWNSWEGYCAKHDLKDEDIAAFPLVPTILPSMVSLKQCRDGYAPLLVPEDHSQEGCDLRKCFRELRSPVVYVHSVEIPESLRQIFKTSDFPPLKLQNVLSSITRTGVPIPGLFGRLDNNLRNVFADWARKNITDIPDDQISLARTLPIWWSGGGGSPRTLRSASEVQLLPEKFTLQDAADFMAGYVSDDVALRHLNIKHMTLKELLNELHLPNVLNTDMMFHYKQFYEKCANDCRRLLPFPTGACTLRFAKDLFKREPLFTAVFSEDSPFFVHLSFAGFENDLIEFGLQTEEHLDMEVFKKCVEALNVNDPTAAREVFRAFSDILPMRTNEPHIWHELDNIPFLPRCTVDAVRKLPDQDENEAGLEIPAGVTCLDAVVPPIKLVKQEFEAVAWSQRACFEVQPSPRVCAQYPDLGKPSFSEVMAHLHCLSNLTNLGASQRRILLHDVKKVYKHFCDHFKDLKANEGPILSKLRDEPLFLNVDDDEESLNWVKGTSLAIGCNIREGSIQGVRSSLYNLEEILEAAGALTVRHPNVQEHNKKHSESGVSSIFDQLRRSNTLTDVVFRVEPTVDVPNPELLFAHRTFLAASSEIFRNNLCVDSQESRSVSTGSPLNIKVNYSWQCVRSFLDLIYGRDFGNMSLELLLEILDFSNAYKANVFDDVQVEIIGFLTPETVDRIKAEAEKQQAGALLNACTQYESANKELIIQTRAFSQF